MLGNDVLFFGLMKCSGDDRGADEVFRRGIIASTMIITVEKMESSVLVVFPS